MTDFLYGLLLVIIVIGLFNIMIFVHELGHFLAARWRGLQVDRFQIWFGKPIWKKTINGVQYGLGWIPAGGFVALPQMAAMESIEGENLDKESLPPVSPLDKIIVAFAGPLFSLMLAVVAGFLVWGMGKPQDSIKSNVVGGVIHESPAEGILVPGDKILKVDGDPVDWYVGKVFDDIRTRIMLTKGDTIEFEIERDGKVMVVNTEFDIRETGLFQRRALPDPGITAPGPAVIGSLAGGEGESPAKKAKLEVGDQVLKVDGKEVFGTYHVSQLIRENQYKTSTFTLKRGDKVMEIEVTPVKPKGDAYKDPMVGIAWDRRAGVVTEINYPNPWVQVRDSLRTMWMTIKVISSPDSNIGPDQLAGPVGIARTKFLLLQEEHGWLRVLAFFVLFNVNLAVLNMLPLPVLDGGHIVMAVLESVRGKPLPGRFLEMIQGGFALLLMGFMLYITTKDLGDIFSGGADAPKLEWPE